MSIKNPCGACNKKEVIEGTDMCKLCTAREEKGIQSITIRIWPTEQCEGGYMYDIFDTEEPDEDTESIDGGQCTTTLENAIEMASEQARQWVANSKCMCGSCARGLSCDYKG